MLSLLRNGQALALLCAASLTILSNTLISPALPGLRAVFKDQPNVSLLVSLLVTAPSLMVAIVAPFAGALADRFGRKRQLLIGVLLFAIAGSAGLWLTSLIAILVSRLVLGVSVALIMTAQTLLIGDYFKADVRTGFMGLQIAASNFSGVVFVLVAGWLAALSPFQPFAIYLVAVLYLPLMWMKLTQPDQSKDSNETAIDSDSQKGWPFKLSIVGLLAVLTMAGFYVIPTQASFFLAKIGFNKPSASSIMLATLTFSGGLVSLFYSRVRAHFGRALTAAAGFAFFALSYGFLSVASTFPVTLVSALLLGAATGLLLPMFLSVALDITPAKWRGLASGVITASLFIGQFISPLIAHPLIEAVGFPMTFRWAAGMFIILGTIGFFVFREAKTAVALERVIVA